MRPTLLQEVEQLLYTHAPNMPFKRAFLAVIKTWEDAYLQQIAELEKANNSTHKMDDDGYGGHAEGNRYEGID